MPAGGIVAGSDEIGNVADLVRNAARTAGDRTALIDGPRSMTWSALDAQVDRAASALTGLGLPPGSRVALALGNTLEFPVAYFGVLRAGLVALPVNPGNTAREFAHVLSDSGAAVVVAGPDAIDAVQAALGGVGADRGTAGPVTVDPDTADQDAVGEVLLVGASGAAAPPARRPSRTSWRRPNPRCGRSAAAARTSRC